MILPIYSYGHPILKEKADEVPEDYENLDDLVENMFETMDNADGVGLAGPQVGLKLRLFVIDTEQLKGKKSKVPIQGVRREFINPVIQERLGDQWTYEEGCLSIPGVTGDVDREVGIKMTFYDRNFQKYKATFEGMEARVIQHEYDHVEGVLFTDYFKAIKRRFTKKKLKKVMKGKMKVDYPMKFPRFK